MPGQNTSDDNKPDALALRDYNTGDMVIEVDPITHLCLDKPLHNASTRDTVDTTAFLPTERSPF